MTSYHVLNLHVLQKNYDFKLTNTHVVLWKFQFLNLDSHHKLIRSRLVTHGEIDGYSRLIVYHKCTGNIRTTTVYESFLKTVQQYHLPSQVWSDQGGENILVAQHVIENRGADQNSMIVGASVHNQHIERLWRDICISLWLVSFINISTLWNNMTY